LVLQKKSIFLTKVMRIWLEQLWQVRKLNKNFESIHVIKALDEL